jgi:hypothetical protein
MPFVWEVMLMQKKRQRKMSERRRAVVATRKAQVAELKGERFADIAQLVSKSLEPFIAQLVKAEVAKAIADFASHDNRRPIPPGMEGG